MERRAATISDQVLEEASSWFIDFHENQVDYAGRVQFNAWLRRSPECVRAFLQVAAFWEDAGTVEQWSKVDTQGLIASALAEQNIVHLGSLVHDRTERGSDERPPVPAGTNAIVISDAGSATGRRRDSRPWLAAAAVLLTFCLGFSVWYAAGVTPTYITGIGEQRSITLEDGSVVELNARSRLRVSFTAQQRSVELLEGQALFTVAKNPARPFVVTTSETRVRAVGTQFDVYHKRSGTVVTVVEGRVAVNPTSRNVRNMPPGQRSTATQRGDGSAAAMRPPELLVTAGEQVTVTPAEVAPPAQVNTAVVTAWTEKKLIFESAPLREVVEEFNRYNRQQLVIRDPELLDFHVSGVFPSTDSRRMIEFLRQRFGVTMNDSDGQIEIHRRDNPKPSVGETKTF
jgi:transmembrane sensor